MRLRKKIEVVCVCKKRLRIPINWEGKSIQCPACHCVLRVPARKLEGDSPEPAMWASVDRELQSAPVEYTPPGVLATTTEKSVQWLQRLQLPKVTASQASRWDISQWSNSKWKGIAICGLFLISGLVFSPEGCVACKKLAQIHFNGVATTGTILSAEEGTRRSRGTGIPFLGEPHRPHAFTVTYSDSEQKAFTQRFVVDQLVFSQHAQSNTITDPNISIVYSKSNPQVAVVSYNPSEYLILLSFVFVAVGSVGLVRLLMSP